MMGRGEEEGDRGREKATKREGKSGREGDRERGRGRGRSLSWGGSGGRILTGIGK